MTKIILLIISTAILGSCNLTQEQKAHNLIEANLKETLNDYKSYESVKFGSLVKVSQNTLLKELQDQARVDSCFGRVNPSLVQRIDSLKKMKPDSTSGYTIIHQFRAKNRLGAYVLMQYKYFFSSDLKRIIKTEDTE